MNEQQTDQPTEPSAEVSDQQLIDGNHLLDGATNSFMDDGVLETKAEPQDQAPTPSVGGTPDRPEFPEEEGAEPLQLSRDAVALERREAELRNLERDLAYREQQLVEEEQAPVSFRESPKEAFVRLAQENGLSLEEAYDRLTHNILGENEEVLESERLESRFQSAEEKVQHLEQRLQDQAFQQEEDDLYDGLADMVEDMAEQFPIAASRGDTTVQEIFQHIVNVANETGEVLDAHSILEQYERTLHQQITELSNNNAVRQLLGLAAQQNDQQNYRSAHEVAQGTPTLTNRSAGERSVLSGPDQLPDEDEMIRLASEAFLGR